MYVPAHELGRLAEDHLNASRRRQHWLWCSQGYCRKKRTTICQQIYVFTALSTIYKAHFFFFFRNKKKKKEKEKNNKKKLCFRDMRQLPTQDGSGTSSSNSRDDFDLRWPIEMRLPTSLPSTCRLCIKQTFSYSGSTPVFPKEITEINETLYFTNWSITIIPLNLFSLIFPSWNLEFYRKVLLLDCYSKIDLELVRMKK